MWYSYQYNDRNSQFKLKNKKLKIFIYLVPKQRKKHYNECTERIIIKEFIELGYKIFPIYNYYLINTLYLAMNNKIDGIIVNSIKILWTNKLLIKINSFIPIYWWYFDNPLLREKNYIKSIQIAKKVSILPILSIYVIGHLIPTCLSFKMPYRV